MRYLCQVSSYIELLTFLNDCFAALQLILSHFIGWRGGRGAPALPFSVTREHTLARPSGSAYAECSLRSKASAVHFVTLPMRRPADLSSVALAKEDARL